MPYNKMILLSDTNPLHITIFFQNIADKLKKIMLD